MDRKLIRLAVEDINLTEVENSVLVQTAGDTDFIFDAEVFDVLIERYLELMGLGIDTNHFCDCEDGECEGCGDDVEKEVW